MLPLAVVGSLPTVALHADRQIYARDGDFMYRMAHNGRIMRGEDFLADQQAMQAA